jgi:hypothetical protein
MQVLRLTTPKLHPADEDLSAGAPETEKRLGPLSLRMTAFLFSEIQTRDTGLSQLTAAQSSPVKKRALPRSSCGIATLSRFRQVKAERND